MVHVGWPKARRLGLSAHACFARAGASLSETAAGMCAQLQSLGGWRLCGRNMHGPDALIDARLAGTRAPAWVAVVGNEGIFGGVSSHCGCFAEGDESRSRPTRKLSEK